MTAPSPKHASRIGLFWRLPTLHGFELVSFSRATSEVPNLAGFKTLDQGHVDLWPTVVSRRPWLIGTNYEQFPRGRVNQIMETGRFVVLADARLLTNVELSRLMRRFRLNASITETSTDPHYISPRISDQSTSR